MSKHSRDQTAEEKATVPSDTDTDHADDTVEDRAAEESTEEADEPSGNRRRGIGVR